MAEREGSRCITGIMDQTARWPSRRYDTHSVPGTTLSAAVRRLPCVFMTLSALRGSAAKSEETMSGIFFRHFFFFVLCTIGSTALLQLISPAQCEPTWVSDSFCREPKWNEGTERDLAARGRRDGHPGRGRDTVSLISCITVFGFLFIYLFVFIFYFIFFGTLVLLRFCYNYR